MINRTWCDNGEYDVYHKTIPIKQVYARIYIKSVEKIVIVSKDGNKWQLPGGKPEGNESIYETLCREINEETGININTYATDFFDLKFFGYYYIEEDSENYLQIRYFIEIDDLKESLLKPNEIDSIDYINFVRLVNISEIQKLIPWIGDSLEFKSFLQLIYNDKNDILENILNKKYGDDVFNWNDSKNKWYINTNQVREKIKNFLLNSNLQSLKDIGYYNPNIISFLKSGCVNENHDHIVDTILKKILGISFFEFHYNEGYQNYIRAIIDYRIIETNVKNIDEYHNNILFDENEKNLLIGYISPSTSYFFRDNIFSEIKQISKYTNTNQIIKILILGSSTGAEVYSIAYSLREQNINYKIIATDINKYALEYAKKGEYPNGLIKSLDTLISNKLIKDNKIKEEYKENIIFEQLNILSDCLYPKQKFDIIVVRNTIKYFSESNRKIIFSNIKKMLKKEGLLMVGLQNGSNKDINPNTYIPCDLIGQYTYKIN